MQICVLFGGAGFIGTHLIQNFLSGKVFSKIYLLDIKTSPLASHPDVISINCDVRNPIKSKELLNICPDWIFNLAAIHREPGHEYNEYFETNLLGAKNVCEYAEKVNCQNIYFTSSISVYGPCLEPTDETSLPKPITPYGGSKYPAELIHVNWVNGSAERRLIIVRPGVIYGPGDPGNILRMISAIRKGYFVFPGRKNIYKSYGYIYGLIDSIHFTMNKSAPLIIYNYCEHPTETIGELAAHIKSFLRKVSPILAIPKFMLLPISKVLFLLMGDRNPIHPVRVRKASIATNIIPGYLIENGFEFKYDFKSSLMHWSKITPKDFGLEKGSN